MLAFSFVTGSQRTMSLLSVLLGNLRKKQLAPSKVTDAGRLCGEPSAYPDQYRASVRFIIAFWPAPRQYKCRQVKVPISCLLDHRFPWIGPACLKILRHIRSQPRKKQRRQGPCRHKSTLTPDQEKLTYLIFAVEFAGMIAQSKTVTQLRDHRSAGAAFFWQV